MARKRNAGIGDDRLLHRRCDDGRDVASRGCQRGSAQHGEDRRCIARVQLPRNHVRRNGERPAVDDGLRGACGCCVVCARYCFRRCRYVGHVSRRGAAHFHWQSKQGRAFAQGFRAAGNQQRAGGAGASQRQRQTEVRAYSGGLTRRQQEWEHAGVYRRVST